MFAFYTPGYRPSFLGEHPTLKQEDYKIVGEFVFDASDMDKDLYLTPVLGALAKEQSTNPEYTGKHYQYTYKGIKIDPYTILVLYRVSHPAVQHAIKKLLRLGRDGEATVQQEVREAISSLKRAIEMKDMGFFCDGEFHAFLGGHEITLTVIFHVYGIANYSICKALEILLVDSLDGSAIGDAIWYLEQFLELECEP